MLEDKLLENPNDTDTIDSLGKAYFENGDMSKGFHYLKQSYSLKLGDATTCYYLALYSYSK